jgi:methylmalonyl-CoA/ethylmalonyl-CoA epimerase
VIRGIHHVGIAVRSLAEAYRFYRDALGLPLIHEAEVPEQGVRAALLAAGDSEVELLEPLGAGSGMAKFIERRGEGLHHVCFETPDVGADLIALNAKGAELIDATPRIGLAGRIGFVHPRACAGVLVELATTELAGSRAHARPLGADARPLGADARPLGADARPLGADARPLGADARPLGADARPLGASGLRFRRAIIGAKDPRATAGVFQRLFELPESGAAGPAHVMLAVGRTALQFVPPADAGGVEGMAALTMVAADVERARAALAAAPTTHGVTLHITRDE